MGRLSQLIIAALLLVLPATRAAAWGSEGHRIVAALAYDRLTPRARETVDTLIAHSAEQGTPSCPVATLMDAATWPDCVRPLHQRFDYLAAMHYEDVPLCETPPKVGYCPDGLHMASHAWSLLAFGLVVASVSAFAAIWA